MRRLLVGLSWVLLWDRTNAKMAAEEGITTTATGAVGMDETRRKMLK